MASPFRQHALLVLVVAVSLVITGYGLSTAELLRTHYWSGPMVTQIPIVALIVASALIAALCLARIWRLGFESLLFLLGLLAVLAIFGAGPTFAALMLGTSSLALGIWWRARVLSATAEAPLVLDLGVGLALLGIIFYALSPFPVNTRWLHTALLATPIAMALYDRKARTMAKTIALARAARLYEYRAPTLSELLGYLLITFVLILYLLTAVMPDRGWDAMAMHHLIASSIATHGAWGYDIETFVFAQMPILANVIFGHLYLFGGELAAQLFNFLFVALTCNVLYLIVRKFSSRSIALLTVACFISIPLNQYVTGSLYVENTLTFWITAAIAVLLLSELRPAGADAATVILLLAAASMTKLHGALAATVLGSATVFLFFIERENRERPIWFAIVCAVLGAIALAPYLAAHIRTGNPFFPFYNHIFKSTHFVAFDFSDTRWMGRFSWSMPYQMIFNTRNFGEVYSGVLGMSLLALLPVGIAAVVTTRDAKGIFVLLAACAIFFPIAVSIQYVRYLFPVIPLLAVLIGHGLDVLHRSRWTTALVVPLSALVVAANILLLPTGIWSQGYFDLRAAFSSVLWHDLELRDLPQRAATRVINEIAGKNSRVVYKTRPAGALLWGTPIYWQWYHGSFYTEMEKLATEEEAAALLRRLAATHVILPIGASGASDKAIEGYLRRTGREPIQVGTLWIFEVPR